VLIVSGRCTILTLFTTLCAVLWHVVSVLLLWASQAPIQYKVYIYRNDLSGRVISKMDATIAKIYIVST